MVTVSVVGAGNVGLHWYYALQKAGYRVTLWGRNAGEVSFKDLDIPIKPLSALNPKYEDIVFFCVPDDAVKSLGAQFKDTDALCCHVSGTQPMQTLASKRKGVCYFFQSISKSDTELKFQDITVYIEAVKNSDFTLLAGMVEDLGMAWRKLDSVERLRLHLCGVLINNFGNQLLDISQGVLANTKLQLSDLKPLYDKTLEKAVEMGPKKAQTGPAKRGDKNTLSKHITLLEVVDREAVKAYKILSKRIKKRNS